MRRHWTFRAAAWSYLVIAALMFLAVALAPWLAIRRITTGLYVVGALFIAVPLALGLWSDRVFRGRSAVSYAYLYAGVLPVTALGPLGGGFFFSIVFGVPLLFLVVGWQRCRRQVNPRKHQTMFAALVPTLYVQVAPDLLTVRNPKSGAAISEAPEVAIQRDPKAKIIAVGSDARTARASTPSVELVNPFGHPRSLVSDFTVGEQLLKAFLRRIQGRSLLAVSPRVVLHPQGSPEGGFTQVEIRAFHEMALGAGASQVVIWQGRSLTDQELLSREFPSDGRILS